MPYCDRYFKTDFAAWDVLKGQLMNMVLDKFIFQNRFPYFQ